MNFRGHLVGGVIAGSISVYTAIHLEYVDISSESFQRLFSDPFSWKSELQTATGLFLTALFMSLFPDLDTASLPQRWFFRAMFILLTVLFLTEQMELFALCSFAALTPVLHIHRGWTHWKITPWMLAVILATLFEYLNTNNNWVIEFSFHQLWYSLVEANMYVFACVIGHYTHLILDSRQIKYVPFINNSSGHH